MRILLLVFTSLSCFAGAGSTSLRRQCDKILESSDPFEHYTMREFMGSNMVRSELRGYIESVPQEELLPSAIKVRPNQVLLVSDIAAIQRSRKGPRVPFAFYEILDHGANVLARTPVFAVESKTRAAEKFRELLSEVNRLGYERRDHSVALVRQVIVHQPGGGHEFSFAEANWFLRMHAILEILGSNEIEVESSILFEAYLPFYSLDHLRRRLGLEKNPFLTYLKKTIRVAAGELSFVQGDYVVGNMALTSAMLECCKTGEPTYSPAGLPAEILE